MSFFKKRPVALTICILVAVLSIAYGVYSHAQQTGAAQTVGIADVAGTILLIILFAVLVPFVVIGLIVKKILATRRMNPPPAGRTGTAGAQQDGSKRPACWSGSSSTNRKADASPTRGAADGTYARRDSGQNGQNGRSKP